MIDIHELDDSSFVGPAERDVVEIFAESDLDADLYNRLLGPTLRRRVRFTVSETAASKAKGGWAEAKRTMERNHAMKGGPRRTFCLLDGEESVRWGDGIEIVGIKSPIFRLDAAADLEGVLFLGCFERENFWYWHSDVWEILLSEPRHLRMAPGLEDKSESKRSSGKKQKSQEQWEHVNADEAHRLVRRMFIKAILKMAIVRASGDRWPILGRINQLDDRRISVLSSVKDILREQVEQREGRWRSDYFLGIKKHIKALRAAVFGSVKRIDFMSQSTNASVLALCDSKGLFNLAVKSNFSGWYRSSEFFDDRLVRSEFAASFQATIRELIFELDGASE